MRTVLTLLTVGWAGLALAAPVPKAIKRPPADSLDGTWELVEWESHGRKVNFVATTVRWTIDGEALTVERVDTTRPVPNPTGPRQVNALVRPEGEDATARDYLTFSPRGGCRGYPGRFERAGDTLKFVYATRGDRPAEARSDGNTVFYKFRRVPDDERGTEVKEQPSK